VSDAFNAHAQTYDATFACSTPCITPIASPMAVSFPGPTVDMFYSALPTTINVGPFAGTDAYNDPYFYILGQALVEHRRAFASSGFNGYLGEELLAQTEESRRFYPYGRAEVYARLGQTDLALEWLEKAYRSRKHDLAFLKVNPQLDSLRSDSRFQDLLRRIGLSVNSPLTK
jgi:hypothetical protein